MYTNHTHRHADKRKEPAQKRLCVEAGASVEAEASVDADAETDLFDFEAEEEVFEEGVIGAVYGPNSYPDLFEWPKSFWGNVSNTSNLCLQPSRPVTFLVTSKWSGIGSDWMASSAP